MVAMPSCPLAAFWPRMQVSHHVLCVCVAAIDTWLSVPGCNLGCAGQGIVFETLDMCGLVDYTCGGTVHLVVNNQVHNTGGSWAC
jgi:hypothetical protein